MTTIFVFCHLIINKKVILGQKNNSELCITDASTTSMDLLVLIANWSNVLWYKTLTSGTFSPLSDQFVRHGDWFYSQQRSDPCQESGLKSDFLTENKNMYDKCLLVGTDCDKITVKQTSLHCRLDPCNIIGTKNFQGVNEW